MVQERDKKKFLRLSALSAVQNKKQKISHSADGIIVAKWLEVKTNVKFKSYSVACRAL